MTTLMTLTTLATLTTLTILVVLTYLMTDDSDTFDNSPIIQLRFGPSSPTCCLHVAAVLLQR